MLVQRAGRQQAHAGAGHVVMALKLLIHRAHDPAGLVAVGIAFDGSDRLRVSSSPDRKRRMSPDRARARERQPHPEAAHVDPVFGLFAEKAGGHITGKGHYFLARSVPPLASFIRR